MLLAGVAGIQTGAGFGPARRHSGDAGLPGGAEDRRSGYTEEAAFKEMNTSGDRLNVMPSCRACDQPLLEHGRGYCSRRCRMMMAAFWELYMFHYILINSSWLRKRDAKRRSPALLERRC
jgi:hypothetical protein